MQGTPHPAEEEILRQVHWIRGLAYAILRDFDLAQDVSQDVLLRALAGKPRQGRVLRAWLAAVTRNHSRTVLRERRRRTTREEGAARPEEAPGQRSPSEVLEAHHALTRAIQGLPAEAKEIVLLRYFEDLGFPEIALRLGITENAAHVRLHRTLGLLRAALERQGGDWRTWCLQALPAGALALPSTFGTITEVFLMKGSKTIAYALIALLLLVAGAFLRKDRSETSRPSLARGTASATEAAAASLNADSTAPALQREEVESGDPLTSWIIRGSAKDTSGAPAPHAILRAVLHDGYDAECPVLSEAELRTDASGNFSWNLSPPGRAVFVTLSSPESRAYEGDQRLVLSRDLPPQDLKVTVRRYGALVRGSVRNEADEPISGAEVFGGREPVTTDESGAFELMGVQGWKHISVHAQAAGYAQATIGLDPEPDRASQADFVLTHEFALRGQVTDEKGSPVEGASINAGRIYRTPVLTAADGSYFLGHLSPREMDHFVTVTKKGYCMASERVAVESRTLAEVNFVLKQGVRMTGRVTGPNGEPLDGASLYVGFSPHAYNRVDAVAHADGAFAFPNVPTGKQILVVQYGGMAPARRVLEIPEESPDLSGVDVQLESGHFAGGQVVDDAGTPLANAVVSLLIGGEDVRQRVTTGPDGRFRLEALPAAGATLLCQSEGYVSLEQSIVNVDRDDLTLRMQACGKVAGRVLDGATGMPLDSFTIRFGYSADLRADDNPASGYSSVWMEEGMHYTEAGGEWESENVLEVGSILAIEASAPGYGAVRAERIVASRSPDPAALVLRLMPSAVLRGQVLTAGGARLTRAAVTILRPEDLSDNRMLELNGRMMVFTDEDGGFLLTEVPAGPVHLHVAHADCVTSLTGPLELTPGDQNAFLTITLESGSALRGSVLAPDGTGLAGAVIELYAQSGSAPRNDSVQARADAQGKFEYLHLAPGRYQVIASRLVGSTRKAYLSLACTVIAGQDQEVVLQTGGSARIQGRVTADGILPPGLTVSLHWAEDPAAEAAGVSLMKWQTADVVDGAFAFPAVAPGRYGLSVEAFDQVEKSFSSAGQLVNLGEGESVDVILNLKRRNSR